MKNRMERFVGVTLAINPIFALISIIYLSVLKGKELITRIKTDKANYVFWGLLALSGLVSIAVAIDKKIAFASYFIPFVYIWLYLLGRWAIHKPERFLQDLLRGIGILACVAVVAKIYHLRWSIGDFHILANFNKFQRGEIIYVADNSLGLIFQAGVVGAIGSLLAYWKEKKYIIENVLIFVVSSGGLIVSGSRGAMLGVLVALAFLALRYRFKAIIGGGIVTGILLYFSGRRFLSAFNFEANGVRLKIWLNSLKIVKDYPFFGVGPGNFGQIIDKYKSASLTIPVTCAHSNYLNIFIGWGLIGGLIFWGWQLYILIRTGIKGMSSLQRVIMAILISYYAHVAVNDLFTVYSAFLLGLLEHPAFDEKI